MNYQSRQVVIKALLKLIESAPKEYPKSGYFNQNSDILSHEFDNWLNYVISVLDITYKYTELGIVLLSKMKILQLSTQNELKYTQRVSQIKNEILRLAQTIL